jgi:hypothetical protein
MQVRNHPGHLGQLQTQNSVFLFFDFFNLVTWIGNNDVFREQYDLESQLTIMFQSQEQLVSSGARDFVYINVVPFDRSPDGET